MSNVNLHLGDCLPGLRAMPAQSVDMVVTDPPYLTGYSSHRRPGGHKFGTPIAGDDPGNAALIRDVTAELARVLRPDRAGAMFCAPLNLPTFMDILAQHFTIKNVVAWDKNNWTSGDLTGAYGRRWEAIILFTTGRPLLRGFRHSDVWRVGRVHNDSRLLHPNQKPTGLLERLIVGWTSPGQVVLDPFAGSGSTAVAAVRQGRSFIGWELDPHYHGVAMERVTDAQRTPRLWIDGGRDVVQSDFLTTGRAM